MNNQIIEVGKFTLSIPDEMMYEVATLKVDLRPALINLKVESDKLLPKQLKPHKKRNPKHEHQFKSYYSKRKCIVCGTKRRKYTKATEVSDDTK